MKKMVLGTTSAGSRAFSGTSLMGSGSTRRSAVPLSLRDGMERRILEVNRPGFRLERYTTSVPKALDAILAMPAYPEVYAF
jgi:hypothetical protein